MANKPLSKDELIARLKAIASDDSPRVHELCAMFYSRMSPPEKHIKCDLCGSDICYFDWGERDTILDLVEEIAKLGYDVKIETTCKPCTEKIKKEVYPNMKSEDEEGFDWKKDMWLSYINYVFFFRTSNDFEYHRAIANNTNSYKVLLTLLQNKPKYNDDRGASHYIADEIDVLEFMTGIKFND